MINEKFYLPLIPQHIKSMTLLLQTVLTCMALTLFVYSLYSYQYIFVAPYASASLLLSFFIANGAIFIIYLLKFTSGKILYIVPGIGLLVLVIVVLYNAEIENIKNLNINNW